MTSKSPEVEEETAAFASIFGNGGGKDAVGAGDAREDEMRDREESAGGGSGAGMSAGSAELVTVAGEGEMVPQMAVDR